MSKDTLLTIETLREGEEEKYLNSSPRGILLLLQAIAQKKSVAVLYYGYEGHFIKTIFLTVTDIGIWLDIGPDSEENNILLASENITLVTLHQGAKVQMSLQHATMAVYASKPAFYFPLPDHLYRIQRRDYFRLALPIDTPLKCIIPALQDNTIKTHEFVIINISMGGIALKRNATSMNLVEGEIYHNCKINLPEAGTLSASIQVRNMFEVTTPAGHIVKQAGCEFINLDGQMSMLLQRYVGIMESKLSKLA